MTYNTIQYDVEGEVGILTLNRPKAINAVNMEMVSELSDFWTKKENDYTVKVIVIRGAGEKGFCSGADLKEMADPANQPKKTDDFFTGPNHISKIIRLMRACPQPIVAAVHGPAFGAGLSFAMAADIRMASEDAVFCAQYINVGFSGTDMGSSYFLWRLVGWGKAAEMCLTGNRVSAEEALKIGLANYVYPAEKLMDEALKIAGSMVTKGRNALHMTKESLNTALNASSLEDAIKMENRNNAFLGMGMGVDAMMKRS